MNPFTLLDDMSDAEWSPDLYRDQVIFIDTETLKFVDEILATRDPDPIILLHADHSSRAWADLQPPAGIQQQNLSPIFLALYLPEGLEEVRPYPSISPLNTFRLVSNRYFGTDLDMLSENRYDLSNQDGRLMFEDACTAIGGCEILEEAGALPDS